MAGDFQDFIDEVLEKTDIVDLVSPYAKLKRVGNRFQCLCPLHNDKKTPSFSISPDKQLFHCFGCGAGGNAIHFVMAKDGLDFMDALKLLAERANVPFPDTRSPSGQSAAKHDKKKRMYEINKTAARFFFDTLRSEKGKAGLNYFKNRGINPATIKRFGLGYAPDSWDGLLGYMSGQGYSPKELAEAGLAVLRENGSYYDKFRNRVMFPIIDVRGNIIGFGGRVIDGGEPKYLNSPETLIFKKSQNLFGLNFAKNDDSGRILIMEGYMDVISLHQGGITNAVASLGTAFGEEHAKLLKKYTTHAVLCYDSDEAGQKAADRAGKILLDADIKTRVLTVNDGKDPDEYINKNGADMFRVLIEQAKPYIEYKIDKIKQQYNLDDDMEKVEFTQAAAEVIVDIKSRVEAELTVKRLADEIKVSQDSVLAEVENVRRRRSRAEKIRETRRVEKNARVGASPEYFKLQNAEKLLLSLMSEKSVFAAASRKIQPSDFTTELHRRIAEIIYDTYNKGNTFSFNDILSRFDASEVGSVASILADDKNVADKLKASETPIDIIIAAKHKRRQNELLSDGNLEELDKEIQVLKQRKGGV